MSVWSVAPDPLVQLGVREGGAEQEFTSVIAAWQREDDGALIVADRQARQIRIFDADGRLLQSVGSAGDGPGEFRALGGAFPYPGDSIIAWDPTLRRATLFDRDGRLGRTTPFSFPASTLEYGPGTSYSAPRLLGVLEDGDLLVLPPTVQPFAIGEVVELEATLWRYAADGEPAADLGTFPRPEAWTPPMAELAALGQGVRMPVMPFPRTFAVATGGARAYVATSRAYEIQVLDRNGSLERTIRGPDRDLTLTAAMREAYREEERRGSPSAPREVFDRILATVPFPETVPAYSAVVVDTEGYVWVQEYQPPWSEQPTTWDVFAPEVGRVAAARLPAGFEVHHIGVDHIVGVWTDELDVPFVRVHSLVREPAGTAGVIP